MRPSDLQLKLVNDEAMSFVYKYNNLMGRASLPEACGQELQFVADMASFGIGEFTSKLI
jgi:hypothetical protein